MSLGKMRMTSQTSTDLGNHSLPLSTIITEISRQAMSRRMRPLPISKWTNGRDNVLYQSGPMPPNIPIHKTSVHASPNQMWVIINGQTLLFPSIQWALGPNECGRCGAESFQLFIWTCFYWKRSPTRHFLAAKHWYSCFKLSYTQSAVFSYTKYIQGLDENSKIDRKSLARLGE